MRFVPIAMIALSGCTTSLAGEWEGEVDCDQGSVDMSLDITSQGGNDYSGDGEVTGLNVDGSDAYILLEMDIGKSKAWGAQALDLSTQCVVYPLSSSPRKVDCYSFDEIGWDGADALEAEVENFLGTGMDCGILLER